MKTKCKKNITALEFSRNLAIKYKNYIILEKNTNNTRKKYLTTIHTTFKYLVDNDYTDNNPFTEVNDIKNEDREFRFINEEDRNLIFKHTQENYETLYYFIICIYHLLARPDELISMQIRDINLKEGVISFYKDKVKTKKSKLPIITPAVMLILNRMELDKYPKSFYVFGKGETPQPGCKKFCKSGKVSTIFKGIREELDLPSRLHMYHFKHTGIIEYIKAGVSIEATARQAGIKERTLLKYYVQIAKTQAPDAAIRINYPPISTERKLVQRKKIKQLVDDYDNMNTEEQKAFLKIVQSPKG
mgnify:CR=1 FL=1